MPPVQYERLPMGDDPKSIEDWQRKARKTRMKKILFHALAILAVMFVGFKGLQTYLRSTSQWLRTQPCHGLQRNLSTLPSYYTLPSGHQIPSVALGTASAVRYIVVLLRLPSYVLIRCLEG